MKFHTRCQVKAVKALKPETQFPTRGIKVKIYAMDYFYLYSIKPSLPVPLKHRGTGWGARYKFL
jgi:hypothetical protein